MAKLMRELCYSTRRRGLNLDLARHLAAAGHSALMPASLAMTTAAFCPSVVANPMLAIQGVKQERATDGLHATG